MQQILWLVSTFCVGVIALAVMFGVIFWMFWLADWWSNRKG